MDESRVNQLLNKSKQEIGAIEQRTKRNLFTIYGIGTTAAFAAGFLENELLSLVGIAGACAVVGHGAYYARELAETKRYKEFYKYAGALTGDRQYIINQDFQYNVDDIIDDLELDEIDKDSSYVLTSIALSALFVTLVIDDNAYFDPIGAAYIAAGLILAKYSAEAFKVILKEEGTESRDAINTLDYLTEQRYRLAD